MFDSYMRATSPLRMTLFYSSPSLYLRDFIEIRSQDTLRLSSTQVPSPNPSDAPRVPQKALSKRSDLCERFLAL
jgi:hypothetical protein